MASIEKRVRDGQTTWRAHDRTAAGAQRNKSFTRKVDAERFLAGVESAKVTGTSVDPTLARVTVGAWAERWLDGQAHLKPTTHARYAGSCEGTSTRDGTGSGSPATSPPASSCRGRCGTHR